MRHDNLICDTLFILYWFTLCILFFYWWTFQWMKVKKGRKWVRTNSRAESWFPCQWSNENPHCSCRGNNEYKSTKDFEWLWGGRQWSIHFKKELFTAITNSFVNLLTEDTMKQFMLRADSGRQHSCTII